MLKKSAIISATLLALLLPSMASGQGLLDGVLAPVDGLVGSATGALGSVTGAAAGLGLPDSVLAPVDGVVGNATGALGSVRQTASGMVDIGGIGQGGSLLSLSTGGSDPLLSTSILGPNGIADINVNLGDVGAGVSVGGPNLVDVDIRLPNIGIGGGGNGNNGNNGSNGSNGNNGNNGGGNNGQNGYNGGGGGGGYVVIQRGGGGGSGGGAMFGSNSSACANTNPNQLVALFQQSKIAGWNRAQHVQLIPIRVCREIRNQIGAWLAANPQYHSLVGAAARDRLIQSALAGTSYQPGHILGVQQQGQTLMVYVF